MLRYGGKIVINTVHVFLNQILKVKKSQITGDTTDVSYYGPVTFVNEI